MAWLKITFDPTMPGTARVRATGGLKRMKTIQGRWIVFDKDYGYGPDGLPLHPVFDGETFEQCSEFIDGVHEHKLDADYMASIAEARG